MKEWSTTPDGARKHLAQLSSTVRHPVMDFETPKDKLEYFLSKGVAIDVFMARQTHGLIHTLAHANVIKKSWNNALFFSQLQGILSDHFIIYVAKLYERDHNRHSNISIPAVLKLIEDNIGSFEITQKDQLRQNLSRLGVPIDVWYSPAEVISRSIVEYFRSNLPNPTSDPELKYLRSIRDQRVAHRDAAELRGGTAPTIGESSRFITFAEDFLCVVGSAYTNNLYGMAGEYFFLTDDARRTANSLGALLTQLEGYES